MNTSSYMKHFGSNIGNLAFSYAVHKHIVSSKSRTWSQSAPAERYKDFFDVLVFTAANNINPREDLGWLCKIIEQSELPIVVVGLGVQAATPDETLVLPPGTLRFFDLVRERRIPLGVRGEFTLSFLARYKIETAVVIGCPSNFINYDPRLGQSLARHFRSLPSHPTIALNLEYFRLESEKTRSLTSWLTRYGGFMVLQSDENVISQHRHDDEFFSRSDADARLTYYAKYFLGSSDPKDFRRFSAQYCRTFIQLPSWIDALRAVDISVGTRFHGNMLAVQAERPAIVFTHDTRTKELCETTCVPHVAWSEIGVNEPLSAVIKRITFDGDAFDKNRKIRAREYIRILMQSGIAVSQGLLNLIK